jgi:hypothetical protein
VVDVVEGTTVSYSTTSISGRPLFTYSGPHGEGSFSGEEIRVAQTELGSEITVTVAAMPDKEVLTFTLVLPDRLGDGAFTTFGVVTHNPTSIAGPAGPQTYEVVALEGSAQFVTS